jgi:hypothetical protein
MVSGSKNSPRALIDFGVGPFHSPADIREEIARVEKMTDTPDRAMALETLWQWLRRAEEQESRSGS